MAQRRPVPGRDSDGALLVLIPAVLAAPAHAAAEESEAILYLAARALDAAGAGRMALDQLGRELQNVWSPKRLHRIVHGDKGCRYWEVDRGCLRMKAIGLVVESFESEFTSTRAVTFSVALLNNRQRRGAALLAAVVAGQPAPRSNVFVARFTGVNRKTMSRWMKDPVIRDNILRRVPQWAVVA